MPSCAGKAMLIKITRQLDAPFSAGRLAIRLVLSWSFSRSSLVSSTCFFSCLTVNLACLSLLLQCVWVKLPILLKNQTYDWMTHIMRSWILTQIRSHSEGCPGRDHRGGWAMIPSHVVIQVIFDNNWRNKIATNGGVSRSPCWKLRLWTISDRCFKSL